MDSFVPLSHAEDQFLQRMADLLASSPPAWPKGMQKAAERVATAMRSQREPESQDLALVLFGLLDTDAVAGHHADRSPERGLLLQAQQAAASVRTWLGLPPLSRPAPVEVVGRTYIYFPPAPKP